MNSTDTQAIDHSMLVPKASVFETLLRVTSLSQVLRFIGACAVIASMSLFMFKGWSEGNDISRYLKLLAQTGLLTGVGLLLTFVVKEVKGARVFFGLSLFSVVANFTILGALTYSMVQWDGQLANYPSVMQWVVVDPMMFLPVFCGALAALSLVAYFSFSIFARRIAGPLTLGFLLLSSALLIPVRSSLGVCLIAGVSILAAVLLVKHLRATENLVLTLEGKASLAILFLPAAIILIRALSLYHVDTVMMACLSGLTYVALRALTSVFSTPNVLSRTVHIFHALTGLVCAFWVVDLLSIGNEALAFAAFVALGYGLLIDQLKCSNDVVWNTWNLNVTGFILAFGTLWIAILDGGMDWQSCALVASIGSLLVSWVTRKQVPNNQVAMLSGKIATFGGLALLLIEAVQVADLSNWMLIGIVGVTLILAASLYERFGLRLNTSRSD